MYKAYLRSSTNIELRTIFTKYGSTYRYYFDNSACTALDLNKLSKII